MSGCVVLNFQLGLNHNTDELLVCLCSNPQVRAAKEKDHEKQTPLKKKKFFSPLRLMLRKMLQCCTETPGAVSMLFHFLLGITVSAGTSFGSSFSHPSTY